MPQTHKRLLDCGHKAVATEDRALFGRKRALELLVDKQPNERQRAVALLEDVHRCAGKAVVLCRVEGFADACHNPVGFWACVRGAA